MFFGNLIHKYGEMLAPAQTSEHQLMLAIQNHDWDRSLNLIEESGSDLYNSKCSPLHLAAKHGFIRLMQHLLDLGGPVNATDQNGNTPLHHASQNGHKECVQLLLNLGADVIMKNNASQTPYNVATNLAIRQLLLPLQLKLEEQLGIAPVIAGASSRKSYGDYSGCDSAPPPMMAGPPPPGPPAAYANGYAGPPPAANMYAPPPPVEVRNVYDTSGNQSTAPPWPISQNNHMLAPSTHGANEFAGQPVGSVDLSTGAAPIQANGYTPPGSVGFYPTQVSRSTSLPGAVPSTQGLTGNAFTPVATQINGVGQPGQASTDNGTESTNYNTVPLAGPRMFTNPAPPPQYGTRTSSAPAPTQWRPIMADGFASSNKHQMASPRSIQTSGSSFHQAQSQSTITSRYVPYSVCGPNGGSTSTPMAPGSGLVQQAPSTATAAPETPVPSFMPQTSPSNALGAVSGNWSSPKEAYMEEVSLSAQSSSVM